MTPYVITSLNLINRVSILFRPVDSYLNLDFDDNLPLALVLTNSFDSDKPFHYTVAPASTCPTNRTVLATGNPRVLVNECLYKF